MDLNLLKTFDAIMKTRSVAKAAEELGITGPAVSHAMNRLRKLYNDQLFTRQGNQILPTRIALDIHKQVQQPLEQLLQSGEMRVNFDPKTSFRDFFVSSHIDIDLLLLPKLIRFFKTNEITANLVFDTDYSDPLLRQDTLRLRKADIILSTVPITDPGFVSELLFEERLVTVSRSEHPEIEGELSFRQFFELRHIQWSGQHFMDMVFSQIDSATPINLDIAYKSASSCSAMQMVADTDWITITSQWHAKKMAKRLGLRVHDMPFATKKIPVYMVWHKIKSNDLGLKWLRSTILDVVKNDSDLTP